MDQLHQAYDIIRQSVLDFLFWWKRELLGAIPGKLRQHLLNQDQYTYARFDGHDVVYADDVADNQLQGDCDLVVVLEADLYLTSVVHMPPMDGRALNRAARLHAESAFPLNAKILSVCAISNTGPGNEIKSGSAQIFAARVADIDHIREICRNRGLPLIAIRPSGNENRNFMGFLDRPLRLMRPRNRGRLAAIFTSLAIIVLATSILSWRINSRASDLDAALRDISADIQAVRAREVAQLEAAQIWATLGVEFEQISLLTLLNDLSAAVPESDHFVDLRLGSGTVRISGSSANPAMLITRIEALPYTRHTQLLSATGPAGGDRVQAVQISFNIVREENE